MDVRGGKCTALLTLSSEYVVFIIYRVPYSGVWIGLNCGAALDQWDAGRQFLH